MEVKKVKAEQREISAIQAKRRMWKLVDGLRFFGEVKEEFKRMTWTSAEEMRTYAKIVVGMTFFCGMAIYFADLTIQLFLHSLSSLFQVLFA